MSKAYYLYANMLGTNVSKANSKLVKDLFSQLTAFENLEDAAQHELDYAMQMVEQFGLKQGRSMPKLSSKREYLLHVATDLVILSYSAKSAWHMAMVRLNDGKAFWYFNPYAEPTLTEVTDLDVWNDLLADEQAKGKRWYNEAEFESLNACIKYETVAVLNTPTPWLGENTRLHTVSEQYPSFEAFLDYCQGTIRELESRPNTDWDYDMTVSPVMHSKADSNHYVVSSGIDKGKRAFSYKERDTEEFWYNYEVLPVDILKKFLHLTFLDSIAYKPLIRYESDGVTYGTRMDNKFECEEVIGYDEEEGTEVYGYTESSLTVTPIYADPYSEADPWNN